MAGTIDGMEPMGLGGDPIMANLPCLIIHYLLGWLGHWKPLGQTSFGACIIQKNRHPLFLVLR